MEYNNIGLTEEQVDDILNEEHIYDNNDVLLYEVCNMEQISFDRGKGSVTYKVVIKEISTNKYYQALLKQSEWYLQSEYNHKEDWIEVTPKITKKTIYQ